MIDDRQVKFKVVNKNNGEVVDCVGTEAVLELLDATWKEFSDGTEGDDENFDVADWILSNFEVYTESTMPFLSLLAMLATPADELEEMLESAELASEGNDNNTVM